MKLLMAVSADGYLATGPDDNMRWTGWMDKAIFRLLTLTSDQPLLAGRTTAERLPPLPGRTVLALSRQGLTLHLAATRHPGSWLIGGPMIAYEALKLGLVSQVVLCRGQHELRGGISVDQIASRLTATAPRYTIEFGDVDVLFFTPIPGDP
jgi:dihydrofolate reductase